MASASGHAVRDPKTKRLLLRDGAYWSEPDPTGFKVRGPSYLMDKVKVPCGEALFRLLDCDLFDVDEPQPRASGVVAELPRGGRRAVFHWAKGV